VKGADRTASENALCTLGKQAQLPAAVACAATQVNNNILVRHPFNKAAEVQRKAAVEAVLKRTHAQVAEENAVSGSCLFLVEAGMAAAGQPNPSPASSNI
jgi:hypothetical protein